MCGDLLPTDGVPCDCRPVWRRLKACEGVVRNGTFLRIVCDRSCDPLGIFAARTFHWPFGLGLDHMARRRVRAPARIHQHWTCNTVLLLRYDLLDLDVAIQSDCYAVAFLVNNRGHWRVLVGILPGTGLTHGGVGGLCSASSSFVDSVYFRLEFHPSDTENAATTCILNRVSRLISESPLPSLPS